MNTKIYCRSSTRNPRNCGGSSTYYICCRLKCCYHDGRSNSKRCSVGLEIRGISRVSKNGASVLTGRHDPRTEGNNIGHLQQRGSGALELRPLDLRGPLAPFVVLDIQGSAGCHGPTFFTMRCRDLDTITTSLKGN